MLNIERVIAVQNYAISGSSFIHSLLDDHPQIISIPFWTAQSVFATWSAISSKGDLKKEAVFGVIKTSLPSLFNIDYGEQSLAKMGELQNERIEVDEVEFFGYMREYFRDVEEVDIKHFIISIFVSYNLCYGKKFSDDSFLCFPIHMHGKPYAEYLTQNFREVYFLHMVREPVQNFGSLIKFMQYFRSKVSLFRSVLDIGISFIIHDKEFYWSLIPYELHGKRFYLEDSYKDGRIISSKAIRLEDVHLSSKFTIQKICDWVGVAWSDNLMKSTYMGKMWHNRIGISIKVSGFSKEIVKQKYEKYFNIFDRYRLRLLTKTEHHHFGYKNFNLIDNIVFSFFLPLLILLPFKVEFDKERFLFKISEIINFISSLSNFEYSSVDEGMKSWILEDKVPQFQSTPVIFLTKSEKIRCFFTYLPLLTHRMLRNYRDTRIIMLKIWRERLFRDDSNTYVKMLYDVKNLPKND